MTAPAAPRAGSRNWPTANTMRWPTSRPAPKHCRDYLEMQLGELELDDDLREMADRIMSSLDSNGYLNSSVEDLLPPDASPEMVALAQRALAIVQSLEPPGVGARDLRECLLLQLDPRHAAL